MRRLGVIVPYRDRREHLDLFIPHALKFFRRYADLAIRVLVTEQSPGLPFNRGAIKNVGYRYLAEEVDYICFHDVDLAPLSADYSWPLNPAMLVFHGLPFREDFIRQLFGGVVLLQKPHFEQANGFSNGYWGWGFEDVDLRERLRCCDIGVEHRQGHFERLPHPDEGSQSDGTPTSDHLKNRALYVRQWFDRGPGGWRRKTDDGAWRSEGLNSLRFTQVADRRPLSEDGGSTLVEHVVVALDERVS